ncbi:MAG: hypothetical protein LUF92_10810 [Clostridiales bacterium]|nr:hypothetical protein [Clostridiales bacterium]
MKRLERQNVKRRIMLDFFQYLALYTGIFAVICVIVFRLFWKTETSFVWNMDGWTQHIRALQFYSDWLQQIVKGIIEDGTWNIPL